MSELARCAQSQRDLGRRLLLLVAVGLLVAGLVQGSRPLHGPASPPACWPRSCWSWRAGTGGGRHPAGGRPVADPATPVTAGSRPTAGGSAPRTAAPADTGRSGVRAGAAVVVRRGGRRPPGDRPRRARPPPTAGPGAAAAQADAAGRPSTGEPPVEEVEVTDLLMVVDLTDEVLVVDEHPRYHLAGCPTWPAPATIPLPLDEARTDGFTPCAVCAPDRTWPSATGPAQATARRQLARTQAPRRRASQKREPAGPSMPGPSPAVPACTVVGEHLAGQRLGVLLQRLGHHAVAGPPQLDPVADLQAAGLAGLLHQPDDLADQAGPLQLRRQREVQRDGQPGPLATVQPSRGVSVTIRSPSSSGTGVPSTSTVAAPAR